MNKSQSGNWSVQSNAGEAVTKNTSNQTIQADNVKKKLDEYLVGIFRHIREELWEEYNKRSADENRPDLCLFLSCILDSNFNKLQFNPGNLPPVLFNKQGNFYLIELVEIVSKHCPSLQEISFVIETPQLPLSAETLWAKSFAGFKKLTTLKLDWSTPSNCISFFTHLGSSCPILQKLKLISLPFQLDQQLALVLGPRHQLLPLSAKEKISYSFQFADGHVTPICQSLQFLSSKSEFNEGNLCLSSVFLLRHFPQMKKLPAISSDILICSKSYLSTILLIFHELNTELTRMIEVSKRGTLNLKWNLNASPPRNKLL